MKPNFHIQNELSELDCPMLAIGISNPFLVDEGYFQSLPASILLNTQLKMAAQAPTFQVPPQFFDELSKQILEAIKQQPAAAELEENFPFLGKASKEMPYHVPAQYFEELQPNKIITAPQAKLFSLVNKRWVKWAAAAVIALGLVSTATTIFLRSQNTETLASTQKIEELSDSEIQQYLNHNDVVHLLTNTALQENSSENTDDNFEMVSDEEIQQYLQDVEIAEKNIKDI